MNVLSEQIFSSNSLTRIFPQYCDFNAVHQETFSLIVPNMLFTEDQISSEEVLVAGSQI